MTAALVGYQVGEASDPDGSCDGRERASADPTGEPVTLRRFDGRSAAGPPVQALLRAAGMHVEAVSDIGTAPNGDPVLVLTHLPYRLSDVLAARRLSPGEAVTVLVPLLQTVERMHAVGVAHGALGPAAVRFDAAGTPVLTGFDDAVLALGPRDVRFEAAVTADDLALEMLTAALVGRPGPAGRVSPADPGTRAGGAPDPAPGTATVVRALFDWADPEPVLLSDEQRSQRSPAMPGRIIEPVVDLAATRSAPVDGPTRPVLRTAPDVPFDDGVAAPRPWPVVRQLLGGVAGHARTVRRRVWVTAGAALILLTAAIVLLPGHGAQAEGAPTPIATRVGGPVRVPPAPPVARPRPRASVVAATTDPARAVTALLTIRESCRAAADEACLRRIEDVGSPVSTLDSAALSAHPKPARVPNEQPVLRARSGTTATISIGRATVLLIQQGDHWMLRDVVLPPR